MRCVQGIISDNLAAAAGRPQKEARRGRAAGAQAEEREDEEGVIQYYWILD